MRSGARALAAALFALGAAIVDPVAGSPAADYDPAVPTPESVLGYAIGERITDYHGMEKYLSRLAEISARVEFGSYGSDYEGRSLRYALVTSEANRARLEEIRTATADLLDPRRPARGAGADRAADPPVTVWLCYATDGNETAGPESALRMAYHLAADRSAATAAILERSVVVLIPVMNPSSHERWTAWSNSFAAGPAGNPDPLALEHHPPWGVLTNNNHYLVDLNRESVWASQRESAALRDLYYRWPPAVFVDLHGEYDEFVGPGYQEPLNPLYTAAQRDWFDRFGQVIGERFAGRGWAYSPWETGSFYPGYWESFATLNGAIGFTFETTGGGSRGLRYRRPDGSEATLELAAAQHFEAALAVLETAAAAAEELLADLADFRRGALGLADRGPERVFLLPPAGDPGRLRALVGALLAHGVEIYRAEQPLRLGRVRDYFDRVWEETTFAPGTLLIPVRQPQARLVLTLLRRDLELPRATREAAELFRRNRDTAGFYNPGIGSTTYLFYDVTAWSMPLTYGVPAYWAEQEPAGALTRVTSAPEPASGPPPPPARFGYLVSGRTDAAMRMLIDLLQRDVTVHVAYEDFTIEGRSHSRGTLLVRVERNPGLDLPELLGAAAERHGVAVEPLDATVAQAGPSTGSDRFVYVRRPKIAVLAGDPVSPRSFGDLWFVLERLYELEFTAVQRAQLDARALDGYDVLVLPDGSYEGALDEEWAASLESWIARGGVLVCLKRAAAWAASAESKLTAARTRPERWPPGDEAAGRRTMAVPGAILRARADPRHFLTQGYGEELAVLVHSGLAFEAGPEVAAPVTLAGSGQLRLAGFAFDDSLERLAETPYLMEERSGAGRVVLFLDDPNFRVYWHSLTRLFLNAVVLGPSF